MSEEFTTIGGIRFCSDQLQGFEKKGNSFTVTLVDGAVFNYQNQDKFHTNAGKVDYNGKIPTIFGQNMNKGDRGIKDITITNCNLANIQGTKKDDIFVLNDTRVREVNISGDSDNLDMLVVNGNSNVEHSIYVDDNDRVIDNRKN
jgi:hypothetical protein